MVMNYHYVGMYQLFSIAYNIADNIRPRLRKEVILKQTCVFNIDVLHQNETMIYKIIVFVNSNLITKITKR